MSSLITDRYPLSHQLEDGAAITMSLMSSNDREQLSKFLARLSNHDLLYLQVDITQPQAQQGWFDAIETGQSIVVSAYDPARFVGYASVHLSSDRQSGEIRVNIDRGYRSRGLGRSLIAEIFFIAETLNLQIVTARMTSDQYGAISAFRRLGFSEDSSQAKQVTDASGNSRELLVMAKEMAG